MAQDTEHKGVFRNPKKTQRPRRSTGEKNPLRPSGEKTVVTPPDQRHECLVIAGEGSCPGWEEHLTRYPMIDSVQREDFPEHSASFVYLAHFYRTGDPGKERSCARKQFRNFFRSVGYTFDSAGDFKSRWFEGVGVRIG